MPSSRGSSWPRNWTNTLYILLWLVGSSSLALPGKPWKSPVSQTQLLAFHVLSLMPKTTPSERYYYYKWGNLCTKETKYFLPGQTTSKRQSQEPEHVPWFQSPCEFIELIGNYLLSLIITLNLFYSSLSLGERT